MGSTRDGAARRDVAGGGCDTGEQNCGGRQRPRIAGTDFEKQRAQGARGRQRSAEPDRDSGQRQDHAVSQHHFQYVAALGAEGHADADFERSPAHHIGDHAEDPDRGQQQGQRGEHAHERHVGALRGESLGEPVSHGGDVVYGHIRVNGANRAGGGC